MFPMFPRIHNSAFRVSYSGFIHISGHQMKNVRENFLFSFPKDEGKISI